MGSYRTLRLLVCTLLMLHVLGLSRLGLPPGSAAPGREPRVPDLSRFYFIVATLHGVTIHDDTDPAGPGEIMIVAGGGSGSVIQTIGFPIQLWREASGGDTFPVNIPLAVIPQPQMGENLLLTVAVADNDEIPEWFASALPAGLGKLGTFIGAKLGALVAGGGAAPGAAIGGTAGTELGQHLASWLGKNEVIGTFQVTHSRAYDQWGTQPAGRVSGDDVSSPLPCGRMTSRAGNMTLAYSVCRVPTVANTYRVFVRLDRFVVHGNGDTARGEVFAYARVADGMSAPVVTRFPARGHTSLSDGQTWNINQLIYEGTGVSPVLHVEVDVWDEDNPSIGDDHDMLGIAPWMFTLPLLPNLPTVAGQERTYPYQWRVNGIDGGDVTVYLTVIVRRT